MMLELRGIAEALDGIAAAVRALDTDAASVAEDGVFYTSPAVARLLHHHDVPDGLDQSESSRAARKAGLSPRKVGLLCGYGLINRTGDRRMVTTKAVPLIEAAGLGPVLHAVPPRPNRRRTAHR